MGKEKYPLSQFKHLVTRIEQVSLLQKHRNWTGNDDTDHHYHIAIPRNRDPLFLHLFWKRGKRSATEFVGTYKLHVGALLSEGYIRADGDDNVRVRICHSSDDLLYIQTKSGKPALAIAELSNTQPVIKDTNN
jgi:hypothetical protein